MQLASKSLFPKNKNILFKPLYWGLGHTTRSIPLMQKALEENNHVYVYCHPAQQLVIEYYLGDNVEFINDPSPETRYGNQSWQTRIRILQSGLEQFRKAGQARSEIEDMMKKYEIQWIVSDAALSYYHPKCHNVLVNHQMNPYTGLGHWVDHIVGHRLNKQMRMFDEIWVPDTEENPLAGELSRIPMSLLSKSRYIGWLSPLEARAQQNEREYLIILSGPQPYRSNMQGWAENFLRDKNGVIVGGDANSPISLGLVLGEELSELMATSKNIICSSGYSSLMDLKNFAPDKIYLDSTPGQPEQEYLRKYNRSRENYHDIKELD